MRDAFIKAYQDCDDEKMEEIRARVDAIVSDPATAEHLKPWYRQLCKRPCFHDEYLQTFNRPNVELVTDTITRITPTGIVTADGAEREFDTIVCATGFQTTRYLSAIDVTGRDGVHIGEAWRDGACADGGADARHCCGRGQQRPGDEQCESDAERCGRHASGDDRRR